MPNAVRCLVAVATVTACVSVEAAEPNVASLDEAVAPLSVDLARELRSRQIRSVAVRVRPDAQFDGFAVERVRRSFVRLLGRFVAVREQDVDVVLWIDTMVQPRGRYEFRLVLEPPARVPGWRPYWVSLRVGDALDRAILEGATFDTTRDRRGRPVEPSRSLVTTALDWPGGGVVDPEQPNLARPTKTSPFGVAVVSGPSVWMHPRIDPDWMRFRVSPQAGFSVRLHNDSKQPVAVDLSLDGVNVWDGDGQWSDLGTNPALSEQAFLRRQRVLVPAEQTVTIPGWPTGRPGLTRFVTFRRGKGESAFVPGQLTAAFHRVVPEQGERVTLARVRGTKVSLVERVVEPYPVAAVTLKYVGTEDVEPAPAVADVPPEPPPSGRERDFTVTIDFDGFVRVNPWPPEAVGREFDRVTALAEREPTRDEKLEQLRRLDGKSGLAAEEARFLRECLLGDDETLRSRARVVALVASESRDFDAVVLPVLAKGTNAERLRLLRLIEQSEKVFLTSPGVAKLVTELSRTEHAPLRVQALGLLAGPVGQPEAAVAPLAELLSADDAATRRTAAESLGRCGPRAKSALPQLLERLNDPDPEVTAAAVEAIRRITRQ